MEESLQARHLPQWRQQKGANYTIPIIQYGGISSSKAPSSVYRAVANYKIPIIQYGRISRLSGAYRAVANYKIPKIQYGGISSSKAPSSVEATDTVEIIRFP